MYVGDGEGVVEVVFVVDVTINKGDPRWTDTVKLLSNVITYMLPPNSRLALVLLGGEGDQISEAPFEFIDNAKPQNLVAYITLEMSSLGGQRHMRYLFF